MDAVFSGRNDILVEGRKISGQAGYCEGGNEYLHGTLMVRVNKDHLEKSLRPSRIKLESKGVRSVAGRVANLSEYIPDITPVQAGGLMAGTVQAGLWAMPSCGLQGWKPGKAPAAGYI